MSLYSAPAQDKKPAEKKKYPPVDYSSVDVYSMVELHTSVRLSKGKKSRNGRCPYPGCTSTHDSFVVYADIEQTDKHIHYWCRKCGRTGDLIQLLRDMNNWTFPEARKELGMLGNNEQASVRYSSRQAELRKREEEQRKRDREELEMLRHLYPHMQAALAKYPRPQAYLSERGITLEQALEHGLGYIPFESETGGRGVDPELKRWTGRIIFPLTGEGDGMTFAGRTLALWKRGMSPDEHKKLLDDYNKQASAQKKYTIARTLKTSPRGYYGYADALAGGAEHIVICEGEFDALSLLVAGVDCVVATGQSPHAKDFPLSLMQVTIALDADSSGQNAMHKLSLEFEAAGVNVQAVIPQDAKDWNDMLIAGKSADILPLFQAARQALILPKPEPKIVVEYDLCGPCLDEDKESPAVRYRDEIGYCESHYLALGLPHKPLTQEQVLSFAHQAAAVIPGGCEVNMIPPGYTIEDRARELAEERRERQEIVVCSSPEEYWERTHKRLKGFKAEVPPEFIERAIRPRSYPAPFPRYELVENPAIGRLELKQVGMWSATVETPAVSA